MVAPDNKAGPDAMQDFVNQILPHILLALEMSAGFLSTIILV